MTEGDSTSVGVDLLVGDLEGVDGHESLGGEGLVDLEEVDVGDGDTSGGEDLGDGVGRSNTL